MEGIVDMKEVICGGDLTLSTTRVVYVMNNVEKQAILKTAKIA